MKNGKTTTFFPYKFTWSTKFPKQYNSRHVPERHCIQFQRSALKSSLCKLNMYSMDTSGFSVSFSGWSWAWTCYLCCRTWKTVI